MDLCYTDATELASLIRSKQLSAKELMQAFLQRQNEINPQINAIIERLDEDDALALAEEADQRLAKGEKIGPLHGLPIAAKEMIDVQGWKTTLCWRAGVEEATLAPMGFNQVKSTDGLLAARMRKAGCLFIGKTNMPTFAFGSHTRNELYGTTLNPYDRSKTVGGSSGGAAAALATAMLPIADGSDLGGSLRNPAGFCNVVGFRPSIGRVPMLESGWAARMATEGPMGRSVRDVALLLAAQAGPYLDDPLSIQESAAHFTESLKREIKGWRIGWTADFGKLLVEPEVVKVCSNSVSIFEQMGLNLSETYPNIMHANASKGELDAMQVFKTLRVVNIAKNILAFHQALGEAGIRKYTHPIAQYQLIDAYHAVTAQDIYLANENRHRIYRLFLSFFEEHDFLLCPTSQVVPFDASIDYVRSINGHALDNYLEWMGICCVISITGLPAISMPCGFTTDGLPLGMQIVGRPGADLEVLQLAQAFEEASQLSAKFKDRRPKV